MSDAPGLDLSVRHPGLPRNSKTGTRNGQAEERAAALERFLEDWCSWVPDKRFALSGMTNREGDEHHPATASYA